MEKLPKLNALPLFHGKKMFCSAQGFSILKIPMLRGLPNLKSWTMEKGALSNLTHLVRDLKIRKLQEVRSKEAGLYLPDPAYDITLDTIVEVDFLSSSWFLSAELVKTLFIETPFTFMTAEDLHLRKRSKQIINRVAATGDRLGFFVIGFY